ALAHSYAGDQPPARAVGGDDRSLPLGGRRDIADERLDERVLGVELKRGVVAALEPDRGDRVGRQTAAAYRPRVVRWIQLEMVRQGQQSLGQRSVEGSCHLLDGVLAVGVEVRTAGVPDEQRIAG